MLDRLSSAIALLDLKQKARRLLHPLRTVTRTVGGVLHFIRFSLLAFTAILPLLGATSVTSAFRVSVVVELLVVAFVFHIFAYLSNDVADLHIDRTQQYRKDDLLVSGVVAPWAIILIALLPIPLSFVLTLWTSGPAEAYVCLAVAYSGLAIYNAYGKRAMLPIITDFLQGTGWGALVGYGATIAGRRVEPSTLVLIVAVAIFVALINGVHGGLRDVTNDLMHHARTTPILLGVRPDGVGAVLIPARFIYYALFLESLYLASVFVLFVVMTAGYSPGMRFVVAAITIGMLSMSLIVPFLCARSYGSQATLHFGGLSHIALSLAVLIALSLPGISRPSQIVVLGAFLLPLAHAYSISLRAMWLRVDTSQSRRARMLVHTDMKRTVIRLDH